MISRRQKELATACAELRIARESCREACACMMTATDDVETDPLWSIENETRALLHEVDVLRMRVSNELYKA